MNARRALGACLLLLAIALAACAPAAHAAGPRSAAVRQRASEVVAALREYRTSLDALLPLQEQALARAVVRRDRGQELFERGIISRREFEETQAGVATWERKVQETKAAIVAADHALTEATTARALAGLPPLAPGGYEHIAGLIRYNGPHAWSLAAGTAELQRFFAARFGRPLPVSAFGQTPLHDRMGFDHRNALDIAVHPDSPEGQALIEHLREAGIPFIAAWGAVPGSTSGAHIHVGQPSPRIAAKP